MSTLTRKQRDCLQYIEHLINENGIPPSVKEIRQGMGLKSPSSIQSHLNQLKDKGYVTWEEGKARTIRVLKSISPSTKPKFSQYAIEINSGIVFYPFLHSVQIIGAANFSPDRLTVEKQDATIFCKDYLGMPVIIEWRKSKCDQHWIGEVSHA